MNEKEKDARSKQRNHYYSYPFVHNAQTDRDRPMLTSQNVAHFPRLLGDCI